MQLGYTRIVESELTEDMVGQSLTLVGSQLVSAVTLLEWSGNPLVSISPMPSHCLLIVSSNTANGWETYVCPSQEAVRLSLGEDNSLDALIVGLVP